MPAAMHSVLPAPMYQENKLSAGEITLLDTPIDLTRIKTPGFILSTREDHIAPWKSTFAATRLYRGPTRFVLAASGHIAGVVNPPAANKYGYWTNELRLVPPPGVGWCGTHARCPAPSLACIDCGQGRSEFEEFA
jgi:polyhydroxyalkanoate synthase subunit PhaC